MKFHFPSFVLGVVTGAGVAMERDRLRPLFVEIGAFGAYLCRLAQGIAAREREHIEDFREEVAERFRRYVWGKNPVKNGHGYKVDRG